MAYIYVKSGGTATGTAGKYSSPKTGSWSTAFATTAEYYGDLVTAVTSSSPTAGDTIYVSNLHNYSKNLTADIQWGSTSIDLKVICVNDIDLSIVSTGASETFILTSTTSRIVYLNFAYVYGVTLNSSFTRFYYSQYPKIHVWENCYFKFLGNIYIQNPGGAYVLFGGLSSSNVRADIFRNCTFELDYTSTYKPRLAGGYGRFEFLNCTFLNTGSYSGSLFEYTNSLASINTKIYFNLCDFSQLDVNLLSSSLSYPSYGSSMIFDRCKFSANSFISYPTIRASAWPYAIYYNDSNLELASTRLYKYGMIEETNLIYRNGGACKKFETLEKFLPFSFKITTTSSTNRETNAHLRFKLVDFIQDCSTTKTFTFVFFQAIEYGLLTNADIFLELIYPKYNSVKYNFRSTVLGHFDSSSVLNPDGTIWTGVTFDIYKQRISVTTNLPGQSGLCSVWVNITTPNKILYMCPKAIVS
jgi:hypothetical protein